MEDRELVESTLAGEAREVHPPALRKLGQHIRDRIDQDGSEPNEAELAEPVNKLRYRRTRDGGMELTAKIDREAAEELEGMILALSTPQPVAPGVPDPRQQTERFGCAFAEIIHLAVKSAGGEKARVSVVVTYEALREGIGAATLDSGLLLPPSAARRMACDAEILPIVLNGTSVPIDVGRKYRCITPDQRAALIARDKGCAFPHCDRSPRWCDGHHVKHWAHGGLTNMDNLVLLCRRHHRLIHHSDWQLHIHGGLPSFTPPTWLTADRTPLRNTLRQ